MKIIACVPTFNRIALLPKVIDAIRNQTRKPDEIVVVNNSSTDGTEEWLAKQNDLIVVKQANLGSSGGQYMAVKTAMERNADWIWIMDDDVAPDSTCLENLFYNDTPDIIRAPLRRTPEGPIFLNDTLRINLTNPFKSFWTEILSEKHLDQEIIDCIGLTFEGPLFSREVVEKTGLPDRNIFIYGDDTDYMIRASRQGFKTVLVKKAQMQRLLPAPDLHIDFSWKHYYVIRNIIALDVMHGNFPVRVIRPFIYWLKWMWRSNSVDDLKTSCKALKDGYFYKPKR